MADDTSVPLTYSARGLSPGTHTATVTAVNASGQSVVSNVQSFTVAAAPGGNTTSASGPPSGSSLTADFRSTTFALDKWSLGGTILTEWGSDSTNLVTDATWRSNLQALGPLSWRVPLNMSSGTPSSSERVNGTDDGAAYLNAIRSIGGTPFPIIQSNDSNGNTFSDSDVSNFVHYFNDNGGQNGGRIERLILGNEDADASGYLNSLAGWIGAAKSADSGLLVWAPAASNWDSSWLQQIGSGYAVDGLDYHAYDGANSSSTGFPETLHYHDNTLSMGSMKSGLTAYGVTETNFGTGAGSAPLYDWRNYTWMASVIGQILSAGGFVNTFADLNGMFGMMNDGDSEDDQPGAKYTTFPHYWAVGMWTGMNGRFARFGSAMCPASSSVTDVDVFAMNNGKVVVVNKGTDDQPVTLGLGGHVTGTYALWQSVRSTPLAGPTQQATSTAYADSTISVTLPAGTVSSFEIS